MDRLTESENNELWKISLSDSPLSPQQEKRYSELMRKKYPFSDNRTWLQKREAKNGL